MVPKLLLLLALARIDRTETTPQFEVGESSTIEMADDHSLLFFRREQDERAFKGMSIINLTK